MGCRGRQGWRPRARPSTAQGRGGPSPLLRPRTRGERDGTEGCRGHAGAHEVGAGDPRSHPPEPTETGADPPEDPRLRLNLNLATGVLEAQRSPGERQLGGKRPHRPPCHLPLSSGWSLPAAKLGELQPSPPVICTIYISPQSQCGKLLGWRKISYITAFVFDRENKGVYLIVIVVRPLLHPRTRSSPPTNTHPTAPPRQDFTHKCWAYHSLAFRLFLVSRAKVISKEKALFINGKLTSNYT